MRAPTRIAVWHGKCSSGEQAPLDGLERLEGSAAERSPNVRKCVDTNTLLLIIVLILVFGGGGFFWRRR